MCICEQIAYGEFEIASYCVEVIQSQLVHMGILQGEW
jgi:hypothetical protein